MPIFSRSEGAFTAFTVDRLGNLPHYGLVGHSRIESQVGRVFCEEVRVIEEYRKIMERAGRKKKEIRKVLRDMKKQRRINLDELFGEEHRRAFEEIDCLECANCCSSLGPRISDRDIDRLAKAARMKAGDVTETWLRIDEEGDYVFKEMPCPFLGADNYCLYYESRPDACRRYPYTDRRNVKGYLGTLIKDMDVCPAVALVMERVTGLV
ncbi:MAG: YkgJ family cysteine cluster protein [Spirochaetales bacterium]|nr:YkgJ family cysteine cluster protein [Spirochaetales bacterium]